MKETELKTKPQTKPKDTQDQTAIEKKLYVQGPTSEDVLGISITITPINGEDYTDIMNRCVTGSARNPKLNRKKYVRELIQECVTDPPLDISRLHPAALAILVSKIEDKLGVGEEARKNLQLR